MHVENLHLWAINFLGGKHLTISKTSISLISWTLDTIKYGIKYMYLQKTTKQLKLYQIDNSRYLKEILKQDIWKGFINNFKHICFTFL
jgi:hypothetical protein